MTSLKSSREQQSTASPPRAGSRVSTASPSLSCSAARFGSPVNGSVSAAACCPRISPVSWAVISSTSPVTEQVQAQSRRMVGSRAADIGTVSPAAISTASRKEETR